MVSPETFLILVICLFSLFSLSVLLEAFQFDWSFQRTSSSFHWFFFSPLLIFCFPISLICSLISVISFLWIWFALFLVPKVEALIVDVGYFFFPNICFNALNFLLSTNFCYTPHIFDKLYFHLVRNIFRGSLKTTSLIMCCFFFFLFFFFFSCAVFKVCFLISQVC